MHQYTNETAIAAVPTIVVMLGGGLSRRLTRELPRRTTWVHGHSILRVT